MSILSHNTSQVEFDLFPDEPQSIEDFAGDVFENPQEWLDAPHPHLGGLSPRKAIGKGPEGEQLVRDLLRAIEGGVFS